MSTQYIGISNILIDAMVTRLTDQLETVVTDDTKIGLIRFGKLQADPTDADRGLNILIHEGGEEWPDELYTSQVGITGPTYEIGGTQWWMRRFTIEFVLFFDGENERDIARNKATIIISHAHKALYNMDIPTDMDSFGEQAHACQVRQSNALEGGGEGTFIWRGKLYLEFYTSITYA